VNSTSDRARFFISNFDLAGTCFLPAWSARALGGLPRSPHDGWLGGNLFRGIVGCRRW
jgi:hypothetical protein